MLLSTQNAAFYLMERGWMPPAALVDGDVMTLEASRRNKNLKVLRQEGPSLFLKQAGQMDPRSVATLRVEATVYQLANADTPFAALRPLLPRFHGYDTERNIIVLEAVPGAESLHLRQLRENAISPEVARALGTALGQVQRQVRADRAAASVPQGTFAAQPPWILSAAEMTGQPTQGVSGAGLQLLQVLQRYPEFPRLLAELRAGWRVETLIHGDIKWDNFLVTPDNGVRLVDWELADWGDPSWDAGAVLQGFLTSWIISIQTAPGTTADFAQLPLAKLRPAIRAFWRAYVEALGIDEAEADRRLDRAVRYGAARMVQTAYEFLQYSNEIAGPAVWLLQVSQNLLKDPRRGTVELFAL
ncbi:MAG: phosphotransferase family protein [Thermoanaerobaculia bacterium]